VGGVSGPIRDVRASDVPLEDVEWLLGEEEPMIPRRGITILAGRRAATKTTLSCWLTAQATAAGINVFFASAEDDVPSFVRPRMEAAGADLERVFFPNETDVPLRFPLDAGRLDDYVQQRQIGLVILDPLSAFVPSFTSPAAARDALTPVAELSREQTCAVVFVHHFRKASAKDPFEAIGGSAALTDVARAVYVYGVQPKQDTPLSVMLGTEMDKDKRALACLKLSGAEIPPSMLFEMEAVDVGLRDEVLRVNHTGTCELSADGLFDSWAAALSSAGANGSALEDAKQFLYDVLKDGPQPSTLVREEADQAGVSWPTIKRAKRGVVRSYKQGDRWFMELDVPDVIPEEWS
jgi:putative DNA primase/helicase